MSYNSLPQYSSHNSYNQESSYLSLLSNNAKLVFHLNRHRRRIDVVNNIKTIPYTRGTTNIADALMFARERMFTSSNGDRRNIRNMIVIITDGESDNEVQTREQAALAKAAGIHITSVGIGAWLVSINIKNLFSLGHRLHFQAQNKVVLISTAVGTCCHVVSPC